MAKMLLEGTVWSVEVIDGRRKTGEAFQTAKVSVLQEGESYPAVVKMPVEFAPIEGEKVNLPVYATGWVNRDGRVNVDLHLSKR